MKTFIKALLLILLCLGLVVAIAYSYSATVLAKIAINELQLAGFDDIELLSARPGLTGLVVPRLKLSRKISGVNYRLNLNEIKLQYSIRSILDKQITAISIGSGELIVKLPAQTTKNSATKNTSPFTLPDTTKFPFKIVKLENLKISVDGLNNSFFAAATFTLEASLENDIIKLSGEGQLHSAEAINFTLNADYNLQNQVGQAEIKTLANSGQALRTLANNTLKEIPAPIIFSTGEIFTTLNISLKKFQAKEIDLHLTAENLGGVAAQGVFAGLTTEHKLHFANGFTGGLKSAKPSTITLKQLNFGPEITNLKALLEIDYNQRRHYKIKMSLASANIFEGQILTKQATFNSAAKQSPVSLELKNINLASILELYPQSKITATGRLDGEIPVSLAPQGISIKNGKLVAQAPGGIIKYDSSSTLGASSNVQIKLAGDVLNNFHYQELRSEIALSHAGDLSIALRLNGKNPDLNFNQPANVNLNIEENLPALFKSLRIISGMNSMIEKALEKN